MSAMTDVKQGFESHTLEDDAAPPSYEETYPAPNQRNLQVSSRDLMSSPSSSSSYSSQSNTFKPIVIPQTVQTNYSNTTIAPFTLAYSPALTQIIPPKEILSFITTLNSTLASSSGLSILSSTGSAISNIHLPIVPLLGHGVAAAAGLASSGTSWSKAKACVKGANEEVFGPRGLRVRLLKTAGMMDVVGGGMGRAHVGERGDGDVNMRRLRALGDRVAPLTFEGLSEGQVNTDTWWKRWEAKEAQKKDAKKTRRARRSRGREFDEVGKAEAEVAKLEEKLREIEGDKRREVAKAEKKLMGRKGQDPEERVKVDEDLQKKLRELNREADKIEREKERRLRGIYEDGEERRRYADQKEQERAQKSYWIVIDKVDLMAQGSGVEDDVDSWESKE